ncbi:MAG: hypothetical protein MZW92_69540 [Comamonadaceae bacterium]|nr:hypothetical protein [Comamonadaceae bacterium]
MSCAFVESAAAAAGQCDRRGQRERQPAPAVDSLHRRALGAGIGAGEAEIIAEPGFRRFGR